MQKKLQREPVKMMLFDRFCCNSPAVSPDMIDLGRNGSCKKTMGGL